MSYFCRHIRTIFVKDIVIELRAKKLLPTMTILGLLIVWIMRIVAEAASLEKTACAAASVWIAFLFAGLLAQQRCFDCERQEDCMAGLILAPIDPGTIYLAKLCVNIFVLCIFEIILIPLVLLIFQINIAGHLGGLIIVLLLGNVGICATGTLFSAIVSLCDTGGLLSVLVFVILMPMLIPATFSLVGLFGAVPQDQACFGFVGNFKSAVGLLLWFDAVYTAACWLLFGFVVRDWES